VQTVPGIEKLAWADGKWGLEPAKSDTTKALHTFQKTAGLPITDQVAPNDATVLGLADAADILIELSLRDGINGIRDFNDEVSDVQYEPGADGNGPCAQCSFWALQGTTNLIVQMQTLHNDIQPGPLYLNCTTYANLALSIYMHGNVTNNQFNADLKCIGDCGEHLAVRYGFAIMDRSDVDGTSVFRTADDIESYAKPDRLYSIECAHALKGAVGHEAIMYNGTVYHSWPMRQNPTVLEQSINEFVQWVKTKDKGIHANGYFYMLQEPRMGDPITRSGLDLRVNVEASSAVLSGKD